ncbi:formate dehydrogenase major subunit [Desulfacinum hydrothermale DSM 13146]|uniref:Formate dehydrogenase major subunit n=1 Tax=Desulfacinum hydrothermale DSM 13146 TaxID=1121390 RepID=A0A1W1X4K6_9BACT|nr:formate dehydrogenase major subunit [Desulfacinum hydrothermale DSM 13146]
MVAVEGEKQYKAACSTPVSDGMVIRTTGPELLQTRKLLLELLLDTHYGDCVAPCSLTCPANVDIQGYLALIRHGEYLEAVKLIKEKIPMPASIGRVCPHPCEGACRRHLVDEPVNINHCKRFVADFEMKTGRRVLPEVPESTGHHVAIVGGGPAGLSAAYYLRSMGHGVTIFEARDKLGGMLRYGIPEYRLPKKILDWEIQGILSLGVSVRTGVTWGRDFTLDDLKKEGYGAIFLAIGAWASRKLGIVGEDLQGVESGVEFLENIAAGKSVRVGKRVAVIGGGNVAIDAARSALRLGAEKVTILYRRSRKEMPASHEEIEEAEAEGVEIHLLAAPTRILGDGKQVAHLEFIRMELGEPDASGRRRPVPIEGSETLMDVDQVISAIGQYPMVLSQEQDPGMEGIPITRWSTIGGDPRSMHTGREMIFVGGDLFRGPMTVVAALADGRKAAYSLNRFFQVGEVQPEPLHFNISKGDLESIDKAPFEIYKVLPRERMPEMEPAKRLGGFAEVELGFDEAQAQREAQRCLACGCSAAFDCRLRELMNEFQVDWREQPSKKIHFQRVAAIDTHPTIALDPNKCIRCERCAVACRIFQCSDAIDFKDWPRFTDKCVSCGLCVDLCPTGALMEKRQGRAVERLHWQSVPSHCVQCGCGCEVDLKVKGGRLVWIADGRDVPPNHASTCSRGRFRAYDDQWKERRVLRPLVRENGTLKEASWGKAVDRVVQGLRAIAEKYGPESVGALASFSGSCEGLYLLQKWMRLGLKTPHIDFPERGAVEALVRAVHLAGEGFALLAPLASLARAPRILSIGEAFQTAPVLGTFVRRAVGNRGASLICLGPPNASGPQGATDPLEVEPSQWPAFLSVLAARLMEKKGVPPDSDRLGKLEQEVMRTADAWSVPTSLKDRLEALCERLAAEPGWAMVVDAAALNRLPERGRIAAFQSLAALAVGTQGEGQSEGAGIYPALAGANSLGALLVGAAPAMLPGWISLDDAAAVAKVAGVWEAGDLPARPSVGTMEALAQGRLKGLFVQESRHLAASGSPAMEALQGVEFLVAQENVAGPALEWADVVLPLAAFGEQRGSIVNQEGRFLELAAALEAGGESLPDWEALARIMAADGTPFPQSLEAVYAEWKELLPGCGSRDWLSLVREKARLNDVC